jgi:ornithine cyclodeaminase/alanine dehydrogenase-like protein (mu-crystallin family)
MPDNALLHYMAAGDTLRGYFGMKIYAVAGGVARFVVPLFRSTTGEMAALIEADALGQIRTGAASGYATDLLANPDADTLGVIGTGFQARTQIASIRAVRPIKTVRVGSRNEEKRRKFAQECGAQAVGSAQETVQGAQIVVTATNSQEPVLDDSWIAPGTMINAMGSNVAKRRELPGELVRRAGLVVVDSLEQAKLEAGDLIIPDSWANVVELKDVKRHYNPSQITIFKSLGICVEDVAAGAFVYERALATPERFADRNRARH